MTPHMEQVAQQISRNVTGGHKVAPHPIERIPARELTIEFDPEPYPEVPAAFDEFCQATGTHGSLIGFKVRPVTEDEDVKARVTATVAVGAGSFEGHGVNEDVVVGAIEAFAAAVAQAR
jgi:hypothetical protein